MTESSSEGLSLQETLRVMDVARTLRRQQEVANRELRQEELQADLKDQLLAAAERSGERLSAEQIDAAIRHYFESLHSYKEPSQGMAVLLARIYIRRGLIGTVAAILTAVVVIWRILL